MTWSQLAQVALGHAGGTAWAIAVGVVVWGLIGVVMITVGYQLARRFGALDLPDGRRWPRGVLALVLGVVTLPLLAGAGAVNGLHDKASQVIRAEVATPATTESLGDLLLAPVLLVRTDGGGDDVRFLLDPEAQRRALDRVTVEILRVALAKVPAGPDHAAWRWLRDHAEAELLAYVARQRQRYDQLLADLRADAGGGLSQASAARQVGRAFVDREVTPRVAGVFEAVRLKLLIAAALLPLLVIGAVRIVAWRQRRAGLTSGSPA
jgi:hypothetical protein